MSTNVNNSMLSGLSMSSPFISNQSLLQWVTETAALCQPNAIYWCDGSQEEYDTLACEAEKKGSYIRLDPKKRPNSFLVRTEASDVARVEDRTFICSESESDAGPTNNWKNPQDMTLLLTKLYDKCMVGRTMYVIPFCMCPLGSPLSHYGIQLTDSIYVVNNMRIMTRMGASVLKAMEPSVDFVKCLHSVGVPLNRGQNDVAWPCNPQDRYIAHFPEHRSIWSFGSGYGGNALLGKKCFSLRIASTIARNNGWLAEHMLILGITSPSGEKKYFAAAFPSACGKTNLAMMVPKIPGWKIECVGDDICWMWIGKDGNFYAVNPEAGFFGVAPGTSMNSNPNAMLSVTKNSIFTNVGLTADGDVWWEGLSDEIPRGVVDWRSQAWNPEVKSLIAHPNARFTAPASQCPVIDSCWDDPKGVKISAIIFGGRRSSVVPLVYESLSWNHGIFMGSTIASEMTAAAAGTIGQLRRDPFAMLPFCGYHMADYFNHWITRGTTTNSNKLPKIFCVNWFGKSPEGKWLWPGYGENSRVLKWIFERVNGTAAAVQTPIGYIPAIESLDLHGLSIDSQSINQLLSISIDKWKKEVLDIGDFYNRFTNKLPIALRDELKALAHRLQ